MILRQPNDPLDEVVLLPLFATVLLTHTQFAKGTASGTGAERLYVQQVYQMCQGAFPAILVSAGSQRTHRCATHGVSGDRTINIDYYDRWDIQTLPMEIIRENIRGDLERIRSNIESYFSNNEGFVVDGQLYPISLSTQEIGDYHKQPMDRFGLGMSLGAARLVTSLWIMPYQV